MGKSAVDANVRIDRVELATPEDTVELSFHPNVTLVTGLARLEREALTSEILGAVGPGRPGLSVDVVADNGRLLEVKRPLKGAPTVRDVRTALDFTDDFLDGASVDVLHTLGFTRATTRRHLHVTPNTLAPSDNVDERIARLAAIDQQVLWAAGITLAEVEVEIAAASEEPVDEADAMRPDIEAAHAATDVAADRLDAASNQTLPIGLTLGVVALLLGVFIAPVMAVPFAAATAWLFGRIAVRTKAHREAVAAEEVLLAQAGLTNYLELQMKKVDELTATPDSRSRALELAELHRYAKESWEAIVGEGVTLEWAASRRAEITEAAARYVTVDQDDEDRAVSDRISLALTEARSIAREAVPVILDDPFSDLSDTALLHLLPTLEFHAPHIQLLVMTDDARVAQWAQQLATGQQAAVIQLGTPTGSVATAPTPAKMQTPARSIVRARRGVSVS